MITGNAGHHSTPHGPERGCWGCQGGMPQPVFTGAPAQSRRSSFASAPAHATKIRRCFLASTYAYAPDLVITFLYNTVLTLRLSAFLLGRRQVTVTLRRSIVFPLGSGDCLYGSVQREDCSAALSTVCNGIRGIDICLTYVLCGALWYTERAA